MGFFGWEEFKSTKERLREQQEYQQKIFPLGEEQRAVVLSALKEFVKRKAPDSEILYHFIVSKQKYVENDKKEEIIPEIAKYLRKARFKADEIKSIIALVMLDSEAQSIESYPTKDAVENFIKTNAVV